MASVNRHHWFKQALKAERWKEPGWLQRVLCVTKLTSISDLDPNTTDEIKPFDLFSSLDGKEYAYWDANEHQFIEFKGHKVTDRLFNYDEEIELQAGDLPNVTGTIVTRVGTIIVNLYMFVAAFGSRVPYLNIHDDGEAYQNEVIKRVINPEYKVQDPDAIYPKELWKYRLAVSALYQLTQVCSASATVSTLTVHPSVLALRDKEMKLHESELSNPAIVADIDNKCVALDIELRKGDGSDKFFASNKKLISVGRKKQEISYGLEGGLSGELTLIKEPLSDGMKFENIPLYADAATAASQSRGLLTAKGGELVKYILRMFQNSYITSQDCGTKGYLPLLVSKYNVDMLHGRFMFVNGKTIPITNAKDAKALMGKVIQLRSPGYCIEGLKNGERNFCVHCTDVNVGQRKNGIATTAAFGANRIMQAAMKKMHGTAPDSFDFVLSEHIS